MLFLSFLTTKKTELGKRREGDNYIIPTAVYLKHQEVIPLNKCKIFLAETATIVRSL